MFKHIIKTYKQITLVHNKALNFIYAVIKFYNYDF